MDFTRKFFACSLALACSLVGFVAQLSAQQLLRWKFEEGSEWIVRLEQTTAWQSTIGGKTTPTRVDCQMELAWKIETVKDGGSAVIAQRFQRLQMNRQSPKLASLVYDSAAPGKPSGDAKLIADSLAPLLACTLRVTLSPRGEMSAAEIDPATTAALAKNSALQAFLQGEGLQRLLLNTAVLLPLDAMKPGDTWNQSGNSATGLGKINYDRKYELLPTATAEANFAKIGLTTTFAVEKALVEEPEHPTMKLQRLEGSFLFDTAAGRLHSSVLTQQLVTTSTHKDAAVEVKLDSTLKMALEAK